MKNIIHKTRYIILAAAVSYLLACNKEYGSGMSANNRDGGNLVLRLPMDNPVDIATYAATVDDSRFDDLLAVVIRDNRAMYEYIDSFTTTSDGITARLTRFDVKAGERLYLFCNTGQVSVSATDSASLFGAFELTKALTERNLMYGGVTQSAHDGASLTVNLQRAAAKAAVTWPRGYSVVEWKICNAPTKGYFTETAAYPAGTSFSETLVCDDPVSGSVYFLPRKDNSDNRGSGPAPKTFLLVNMTKDDEGNLGWFRMDFYGGDTLNVDQAPVRMDILPNRSYVFNIRSVSGRGYDSESEAMANPGSNIIYNMEIGSGNLASSNGQYAIQIDRETIVAYPASDRDGAEINITALIPAFSGADIRTFTAEIVNDGNNQLWINSGTDGNVTKVKSVELSTAGTNKVRFRFDGANIGSEAALLIRMGNISRLIPVRIETANCYLCNFKDNTNATLYIPVAQANQDKNTVTGEPVIRIPSDMELEPVVIWSDQKDIDLQLAFDRVKGWVTVKTATPFAGNAVIGVKDKTMGAIRWSWHIWSMGNDVLEVSDKGYYDFKAEHTSRFNNMVFMDRNLGAYDMTRGKTSSRGLLYQWGRKDPFPGSADGLDSAAMQTPLEIYYNGIPYHLTTDNYPGDGQPCKYFDKNETAVFLDISIAYPWRMLAFQNSGGVKFSGSWYAHDVANLRYDLWLQEDQSKGVYSPCPAGWTVAFGGSAGPWIGLDTLTDTDDIRDKGGFDCGAAGFFPFTSYIWCDNTLTNNFNYYAGYKDTTLVGTAELWWANCRPYKTIAENSSWFTPDKFWSINGAMHGLAFSVRCVREE